MNRRRLIVSMVLFVTIVGSIFTFDLISRRTPVLGLDLRGGLSVIYAPEESAQNVDTAQLELIRDLMRAQLEDFGIAEPDVRVEGNNIIADLPGVNDQESAFDALQVSGIVELRPVLQCGADPSASQPIVTGNTVPDSTPADGSAPDDSTAPTTGANGTSAPSTTVTTPTDTAPTSDTVDQESLGYFGMSRPLAANAFAATTPDTSAPDETTPDGTSPAATTPNATTPGATTPVATTPADGTGVTATDGTVPVDVTAEPVVTDTPTDQTILPYPKLGQICLVGPPGGSGEVFQQNSANAEVDTQRAGNWRVTVDLTSGGLVQWNNLASQCYNALQTCPSRQLAIVLDSEIVTAPVVQVPSFDQNVEITGMDDQEEADNLVRVLDRGAFPFEVVPQRTETVSPSAGQDSLNAAIIAGLVGVVIMLFTMVLYYRRLAIIMIVGLVIWGVTVFTLATLVSRATNFALTLAGATGIIIAVGVTVDTYVVFFERLRDELRAGRSLSNAAPRGYRATGRTVLSADVVSLLASLVLFALSVGSVRGFALYLGITTVCDLLVFYFFTRPAVLLAGMSAWGRQRSKPAVAAAGATS